MGERRTRWGRSSGRDGRSGDTATTAVLTDVNINNAERTIILVIIITIIINSDSRSQVSEMY